ncbi:class I SAM-dependent methyltransferase [Humidisolicoccus flavus]|uniref:class I SAM-dependent methyltransferase n=1 Tax=Humidisolicoccus flavus TaxID=3111414 RepID=UPI00324FBBA5
MARTEGRITRGTTGVNRLRRVDRWIQTLPPLRTPNALVVDLGFGASATTTLEMAARLREVNPSLSVLGFEIDPERVARANAELEAASERGASQFGRAGGELLDGAAPVRFALGGFEIPSAQRPHVIRAMNVLRQYEEHEVSAHWKTITARLAPGGVLVEGTSNESGRVASWVTIDANGPRWFTIAVHIPSLESPSIVAERLPKALIHRNVEGEPIHAFLRSLEDEWVKNAPLTSFSASQRWLASVASLRERGVPVQHGASRWRLGEVTVPWESVAPRS